MAIAHSCPSGAITYERHDGSPQETPPPINVLRVRENGPYAIHAAIDLAGHGSCLRATLCRCGKSANKPFCDNSHREAGFTATGEPATTELTPLETRDGTLHITPLPDGPLRVIGNLELCSGTGRAARAPRTPAFADVGALPANHFATVLTPGSASAPKLRPLPRKHYGPTRDVVWRV